MRRALAFALLVSAAAWNGGCVVRGTPIDTDGDGLPDDDDPHPTVPDDPDDPEDPDEPIRDGASLYAAHCASCHASDGAGTQEAPSLQHWIGTRDALIELIDLRMPRGDPQRCTGECATLVADFILDNLQVAPSTCSDADLVRPEALPPRALRLLTRAEYRRAIRDLFGSAPCGTVTFLYDPAGQVHQKVHVAGSFNAWPAQWANGVQLSFDDALGVWKATTTLAPGSHQYKIVLDETTWIPDPNNALSAPDGFGGTNSLIEIDCAGDADVTATIPPDVRPAGFPFDGHAASGLVTTVHVEEYLGAAAGAVARATLPPDALRVIGRRAFRRPLTQTELERYGALEERAAIEALLSSPNFLYRSEIGADQGDGTSKLDAFELASALSFAIWGTIPDDALLDAAEDGLLATADDLEREARRLLADPRARDAMGDMALQWLEARSVRTVDKSPALFPGFDDGVREDLALETSLFFAHVMFDASGRYDELLTSTQGFVTSRTAGIYGVSGPSATPTLIDLPEERSGILSQASVLASTAHSDQTSPIRRGLFVRRQVLCQDLGAPPPNAGGVPDVDPNATTRERFAQHTANTFCASCHVYIDPVGFGFEQFDPIGRVRTSENGMPIDHAGDMNDVEGLGTSTSAPLQSMSELATTLAHSDAAETCFVRQMQRYVQGAEPSECASADLAAKFRDSGGDLKQLVIDLVRSPAFALRRNP